MLLNDDRRAGAGTGLPPRKQTLPGDQLAARTDCDDRCHESSVVPDGLRMIAPSADEVWDAGAPVAYDLE
jgi:hypothetical protein